MSSSPIIVSQLKSHVLARENFIQAKALADFQLNASLKHNGDIYPAMMSGVIVCYARCFVSNTGAPNFSGKSEFTVFEDDYFQKTHDKILADRNNLSAHLNTQALKDLKDAVENDILPFEFYVVVEKSSFFIRPSLVTNHPEFLERVIDLCREQIRRVDKVIVNKLNHLGVEPSDYPDGHYFMLGDDFPEPLRD